MLRPDIMKNQSLVLTVATLGLFAAAIGCSRQESSTTSTPTAAAEVAPASNRAAAEAVAAEQKTADALKAADAQKAAEALQAADAQKLREAAAQKEAESLKAEQALKQAALDKVTAAQAAAETQRTAAAGKVQVLIDSAKALAGQNKWTDVLKVLTQLAGEPLSAAQQTTVDGLKSQAQKQVGAAIASKDAANALGGLLAPKK
jgi:hypothetical protein